MLQDTAYAALPTQFKQVQDLPGQGKDVGRTRPMSHNGSNKPSWYCRRELLKGPLYYVLVLLAVTLLFWRQSPIGITVVALMCGGDGLADLVGRKFGSAKLPFNQNKSWAGSLAMFLGELFCLSIEQLPSFQCIEELGKVDTQMLQLAWQWNVE